MLKRICVAVKAVRIVSTCDDNVSSLKHQLKNKNSEMKK